MANLNMRRLKRLLEIILLLFIAIGFNADLIFPAIGDFILLGTIVLCLFWFIAVLTGEDRFKFQKMGFSLVLLRIVVPVMTIILTIVAHKMGIDKQDTVRTKEPVKIEQRVDSLDCASIRYGLFKHVDDTISRICIDGNDYEIHNSIDTFNVVWIDSCRYRIQKDNGYFKLFTIAEIYDNFVVMELINNLMEKEEIIYERIR